MEPVHQSCVSRLERDATILADFMLARATSLIRGLVVNGEKMKANLELTGGLFFSEAVLLSLVRSGLARQHAYEIVQRSALAADSNPDGHSFRELLGADPDVGSRLSEGDLDAAFDLNHHLRHVVAIFGRVFNNGGRRGP